MNSFDVNKSKQIASDFIKKFEGYKLKAYQCSAKVWTIGWGNTSYLKNINFPQTATISQEKAEQLFKQDLDIFFNPVLKIVNELGLNENQVAALVSFAFNLGLSSLQKSTLLKVIQADKNNFVEIEKQFLKWVNAGGKKIQGLVNRRTAEAKLYQITL